MLQERRSRVLHPLRHHVGVRWNPDFLPGAVAWPVHQLWPFDLLGVRANLQRYVDCSNDGMNMSDVDRHWRWHGDRLRLGGDILQHDHRMGSILSGGLLYQ